MRRATDVLHIPKIFSVAGAILGLAIPTGMLANEPNPWGKAKTPAKLSAEAIGGYSAGCLAGAEELPKSS